MIDQKRAIAMAKKKKKTSSQARKPRRCHWFRCQKCGQDRPCRYDQVPRTPCHVCRGKAIDYHYRGLGRYPDQDFLEKKATPCPSK